MTIILKNHLKLVLVSVLLIFGFSALTHQSVTAADAKDAVCEGIGAATGGSGCEAPGDEPDVDSTLKTVINLLSIVIGIASVIMVIIGGFKYVTSQGESSKVTSAKNTIIYALVGLVVAALAQIMVQFVIGRVSNGSNNTNTNTTQPCGAGGQLCQ